MLTTASFRRGILALTAAVLWQGLRPAGTLAAAAAANRVAIRIDPGVSSGRTDWPLGVGVPFPKGTLRSADFLRVLDARTGLVPSQVAVRRRWPDGTIKWVWLDFQGDPAGAYSVAWDGVRPAPRPAPALRVTRTEDGLVADTGRLRLEWDSRFATPVRVVLRDGTTIHGDGKGIRVRDSRGRDAVLGGPAADLRWAVETRPARSRTRTGRPST